MDEKIQQLKDLVLSLIDDVHRLEIEWDNEVGSDYDSSDRNKQDNLKYLENILSGSVTE